MNARDHALALIGVSANDSGEQQPGGIARPRWNCHEYPFTHGE